MQHNEIVVSISSNRFRLNPQKSQYIWFSIRQPLDKLKVALLSWEFPTFSLFYLCSGPIGSSWPSSAEHIIALIRSCFYHPTTCVYCGWSRAFFPLFSATLVHAFIVNCVDHCSSLYCGLLQARLVWHSQGGC